jgi:hypothetical protein
VVRSCPCSTKSTAFFFNFGHMFHIIASVPTHHQGRPVTVRLRTVLRTEVSMFFFCKGRSVTSDRPSGRSSEPSVCPTGGDLALVLGGGLWCQ